MDRRFYRKKYDAGRVLAAFSVTLRDGADLNRLTPEMLRVVRETMQPEHASLWLREPAMNKKPTADSERPIAIQGERT